jgi:hypothetical protein
MCHAFRRMSSIPCPTGSYLRRHWAIAISVALAVVLCLSPSLDAQTATMSPGYNFDAQGTLETLVLDYPQAPVTRYFLNTGQERVELRFAGGEPIAISTGTLVRVQGNVVGDQVMLDAATGLTPLAEPSLVSPTPSLSSTNTFGDQPTAVLLVNFQDDTSEPFTPAEAHQVVFTDVDAFYRENSQNQTWLSGDVFGYFTLPMSASSCNLNMMGDLADQAALTSGVDVTTYQHVVYVLLEPGCGFVGASYLGGKRIWSNAALQMKVIAHEMGHNFGLYHSHALSCTPNIIGNNCTTLEYGDLFDVMGDTTGSHFNAYQKERLGYLNQGASQRITYVQTPGTYVIAPYEDTSDPNSVKALKILSQTDPTTGTNTYYYVEYRQPMGFDAPLKQQYPAVVNGVLIHTGTDQPAKSSFLLDMNPQTTVFDDAGLIFGQSFVDAGAGLTITALSADNTGAHVKVAFTADVCKPGAPVVSVSPSAQTGAPGTELDYSVTVTNTDTSGCGQQTFTVINSAPPGWAAVLGQTSLTLSPQAAGSTTLKVIPTTNASGGDYKLYVKAIGNTSGFIGFTQLTYSIPKAFALSVDSSSVTVVQGGSGSVTLTTSVGSGFSAIVSFNAAGLPPGVAAIFAPAAINAPGAGESVLTFSASSLASTGTYLITVTAYGGGLTSQVQVSLKINSNGNFALSASPTQVTVIQGSSGTSNISSTLNGSFNAAVTLSLTGVPTGVVATFTPSTLPSPGSGSSTLTFNASTTASVGTYMLTITGTAGLITHTIPLTLTITSPAPPPPPPAGAPTAIPQAAWKLKFVDSQELNCALFPAIFAFDGKPSTLWQTQSCLGTTPLPHEIQIDLGATYPIAGFRYLPRQDGNTLGKIAAFEFYVSSDGQSWGAPAGTGILISHASDVGEKQVLFASIVSGRYVRLRALSAVDGGQVTSAGELNVLQSSTQPPPPAGDFSLAAMPTSVSVVQGGNAPATIMSTLSGSFSSTVALSISGLPAGVSASFLPSTIAAPGSGMSALTFSASSTTSAGAYTVVVTGTAGSVTHSITLALTVTSVSPPPPPPPPSGSPTPIPQSGWHLKYVDSQAVDDCGLFPATFAFDGKPGTMWQTQACLMVATQPHEIQIDLGSAYAVVGFRYLPRQDGKSAGKIAAFEFYVSTDGVTWGSPSAAGTLITDPGDTAEKQVLFATPKSGRYVRLRSLSEVSGLQLATAAELNVLH